MKILYCDWLDLFYAIDQRLAEKQQVWKKCQVRGIQDGRNPRWEKSKMGEVHDYYGIIMYGRNPI